MKKEIKVAFVGCGKHATDNLYPSLKHASMNLVSVCARHLENAERQALLFGAETAYDDYRQMLDNEEIDALIVCVNPELHYEISMEALKRGIPVFVEKPPAPGVKEAKEMLELSKKTNKFLMVGFNKRFGPVYKEAKNLIEKGSTGNLDSIFIRSYVGPTKDEQTLLIDVGIHYIDLLRFFAGDIKNLQVKKKIHGDKATVVIFCEFNHGAIGTLQLSNNFSWSKPGEYIEILGQESLLILDDCHKLIFHKPTIASPGELNLEQEKSTIWEPNYSIPVKENNLIFLNGYAFELRYFAESIRQGYEGSSSIKDGLEALSVIEKIK
jgi:myo-inositol 2-dehydrogenase/D-chiro-inositol 1-dehydrogenase